MTITHNLNEQLLMGYAAGVLPEAFDLVVATHLSMSDESRAMLCCYESLGGCVLNRCEKAAMDRDALDKTMEQIKCGSVASEGHDLCTGIFPQPLQNYVGGGAETVHWKSIGKGVQQAILLTEKKATARLLYIPAGQAVPDHGHRGTELTLVLQGAYANADDRFARGDIEIANEDTQHEPVAESGEDCICLTATDAPLRFKGWLPRMMQPFVRI